MKTIKFRFIKVALSIKKTLFQAYSSGSLVLIIGISFPQISSAQPQLQILDTFSNTNLTGTNLWGPGWSLFEDHDGYFYGTTSGGGSNACGTIFRMSKDDGLNILFSFSGTNGTGVANLIRDPDGNFYGLTGSGGNDFQSGSPSTGDGTFFKLTTNGILSTLYFFNGTSGQGMIPTGPLAIGDDGNFYGMTSATTNALPGLFSPTGFGTIFKITPAGVITTLHTFSGNDGLDPIGGLVNGNDGNFYGIASLGGNGFNGSSSSGYGTIFRITPSGIFTNIYFFDGTNGSEPLMGIIKASDGNFYGTCAYGGNGFNGTWYSGSGTAFSLTTNGIITKLFSFDPTNGRPDCKMTEGLDGNLYGTTISGISGFGSIFTLNKNGTFTNLYNLNGTNGNNPVTVMTLSHDGNLYGTMPNASANYSQNSYNGGTIFRLAFSPGLTLLNCINNQVNLTWTPFTNRTYRIDFKTSLADLNWTSLATNTPIGGYTDVYTDSLTNSAARFYRILMLP